MPLSERLCLSGRNFKVPYIYIIAPIHSAEAQVYANCVALREGVTSLAPLIYLKINAHCALEEMHQCAVIFSTFSCGVSTTPHSVTVRAGYALTHLTTLKQWVTTV